MDRKIHILRTDDNYDDQQWQKGSWPDAVIVETFVEKVQEGT